MTQRHSTRTMQPISAVDLEQEIKARVVRRGSEPLPRDVVSAVLHYLYPLGEVQAKRLIAELIPVENR